MGKPIEQGNTFNTINVVNSYNEWDTLEEVIVGTIDNAVVPLCDPLVESTMPAEHHDFFRKHAGQPFPGQKLELARQELEGFVHILQQEGVVVRRPERHDLSRTFNTPDWTSPGGLYSAMPRDCLMVVGDEIIEVPMAWRSRYFECHPFRSLLKAYFKQGGKWTSAPKPQLTDDIYNPDYTGNHTLEDMEYAVSEVEPVFDAADFSRCGRDIFVQKSHVTNGFGIQWLQRHLGDPYNIHVLPTNDLHPMHIDATFVPLAPGKLLVNPERIGRLPDLFKTWDILESPHPTRTQNDFYMCSSWISMNVFSLDENRIVVEKEEEPLIRFLKTKGFDPIPIAFRNFNAYGGAFHCATLDIRRSGTLESYF